MALPEVQNDFVTAFLINRFGGWLDWPDYFFFWNYHGNNSIFNIPSYQNPAMDKLIDGARFAPDEASYAQNVRGFLDIHEHHGVGPEPFHLVEDRPPRAPSFGGDHRAGLGIDWDHDAVAHLDEQQPAGGGDRLGHVRTS